MFPVVHYGDPVLRRKGARIEAITPELQRLIAGMFETMREAHGIGLAAQQVGYALQVTVLDVRDIKQRPSQLWLDGQPADVEAFMPLVLINPVVTPAGPPERGAEGCLSFPEIYADIERPGVVDVSAQNERGEPFAFRAGGLLARAIQHEADHLNGILFIDRMDSETRSELKDELETLQAATRAARAAKPSP
ncbi:MAG: peptide deformylase [Verrucomicrobiae bacterium]|nr:peptide deformylase [Verrucomicrobiae bacterium]